LFRGHGHGRGRGENPVHIVKESQQRSTLLVREVPPILFNVSPNLRKLVLALGNAMVKNLE
jgi:hypothetical protein